jgi:hypothetical protein
MEIGITQIGMYFIFCVLTFHILYSLTKSSKLSKNDKTKVNREIIKLM